LLEDAVAAERLANEVRRGRHFGEMLVLPMGAVNPGIPFRESRTLMRAPYRAVRGTSGLR
jgi:hypothetical protein